MHISQFGKPVTAKSLNESLGAKFGQKLNLKKFTLEQLQDVRNRLRTRLSQVETNESFDSVQNETYQKSKLMLDILNAEISERGEIDFTESRRLREGEEDKAELVMAAKDMVDRVTGWMEDTAEMQTESMLELADAIRDEHGQESSEQFTNTIKPALEALFQTLEQTRETLTGAVGLLTGEGTPPETMGAEDDLGAGMDDLDLDSEGDADLDLDLAGDDDFGADAAATGGLEGGDRARRESRSYNRGKQLAEHVAKKIKKESVDPRSLASILSKKK